MDDKNQNNKETIEDYLGFVRHEIRNQLVIIREGVSQALDGLGGKDCRKCFDTFLKPALDSTFKFNKLIDEFLGTDNFKSRIRKQSLTELEKGALVHFKDKLIGAISHNLRTPLTIAKEGISLVLDEVSGTLNDKQKTTLAQVKDKIDCLARVLDQTLSAPWDEVR
ncbi:MAG: hypothetical protein ACE5GG_00155 [Candidatus Omnitrophota bacterium]